LALEISQQVAPTGYANMCDAVIDKTSVYRSYRQSVMFFFS